MRKAFFGLLALIIMATLTPMTAAAQGVAAPKSADLLATIQSDIAAGNFDAVQAILTAHPDLAAQVIVPLAQAAKNDLATNPAASAKALRLVAAYANAALSGAQAGGAAASVADAVQAVVAALSTLTAQCSLPAQREACSSLVASAGLIASNPAIVAAMPTLAGQVELMKTKLALQGGAGNGQPNGGGLQLAQQPGQPQGGALQNIVPPPAPPSYRQRASAQ